MRVHEVTITQVLHPQDLQTVAQKANLFRSDIVLKLEKEGLEFDAKSILGMMLLSIPQGTRVRIQTRGNDEEEAIEMMCHLLENNK
ncbi:HPr family phosphocarrier protein [Paenibacillus sp. GD4]|jgi:phosphocarrier protein HPr|uniref:HPr family phosphocarrier protein n=1 Tax=Paenibacillus TaxID=44249 RepID=UPI002543EA3D|nr:MULTISPECIES: HPr family phosphocarrier protein [Paenibacillus]MDQ1909546.1 HPr family phosphocarrier protein [Paenibacillus sp. GD4]